MFLKNFAINPFIIRRSVNKFSGIVILVALVFYYLMFVRNRTDNTQQKQHLGGSPAQLIKSAASLLQDGDIVLRTGRDATSNMFRMLNQHNGTYSHSGIFFTENGKGYIFHCIGGEENPNALIRKEGFVSFVSPANNAGFGICRYTLTQEEKERLKLAIDSFRYNKVHFDMQFSLDTDSAMYCSEFVYKAFSKAKNRDRFMKTSVIKSFRYVAVDNLFLNPGAQMICAVKYKR